MQVYEILYKESQTACVCRCVFSIKNIFSMLKFCKTTQQVKRLDGTGAFEHSSVCVVLTNGQTTGCQKTEKAIYLCSNSNLKPTRVTHCDCERTISVFRCLAVLNGDFNHAPFSLLLMNHVQYVCLFIYDIYCVFNI